jgi:hypothetical protein
MMTNKPQKTLLDDYPHDLVRGNHTPAYNTQDYGDIKEPFEKKHEKQLSQKDLMLNLLLEMDRVPVRMLLNISAQYNARINELNKDLIKQDPPQEIVSFYDPEEKQHYKRLEVIQENDTNFIYNDEELKIIAEEE